jgi:hypothetical protein
MSKDNSIKLLYDEKSIELLDVYSLSYEQWIEREVVKLSLKGYVDKNNLKKLTMYFNNKLEINGRFMGR